MEAVSKEQFYTKWGIHYLPSLKCAHRLQQCNNFKDPGVQVYGGQLFGDIRDAADEVFCKLPAPTPTRTMESRQFSMASAPGSAPAAASAPPINMAEYMN